MRSATFELTVNGTTLAGYSWLPDDSPQGIVHLVHGMAEHAGRYEHLAQTLTSHGWGVYATDLRGHGRTATKDEDLGFFALRRGWATVVSDQHEVHLHVTHLHPGVPYLMLGHSMGSVIVRDYAIQHGDELRGIVLTGPPGSPGALGLVARTIAAVQSGLRGPHRPNRLLDRLTFGPYNARFRPARTQSDWLSRDPAQVDAYIADPRSGFVASSGLYRDLLKGLKRVNDPDLIAQVPQSLAVLVMSGAADPVTNNGRAADEIASEYRLAGLTDVTEKLYPEARHEILNETNRDEVEADIVAWLDAHR